MRDRMRESFIPSFVRLFSFWFHSAVRSFLQRTDCFSPNTAISLVCGEKCVYNKSKNVRHGRNEEESLWKK